MKLSEFMSSCLALISTPETWTKHNNARLPNGESCDVMNSSAAKFCSVGAILRTGGISSMVYAKGLPYETFKLLQKVTGCSVIDYNDTSIHQQVVNRWLYAIDLAIALESLTAEPVVMKIPTQSIILVLDNFSYFEEMVQAATAQSSLSNSIWAESKVQNLVSACSTPAKEMLELEATG